MTTSYRFFLGYSRCNYPFAERLKADLAWAGIDIFCDTTDIPRSEADWQRTIDAAIQSSEEFILLSSPEAEKSQELQREYDLASARAMPIAASASSTSAKLAGSGTLAEAVMSIWPVSVSKLTSDTS
jgi:hypothetical protein